MSGRPPGISARHTWQSAQAVALVEQGGWSGGGQYCPASASWALQVWEGWGGVGWGQSACQHLSWVPWLGGVQAELVTTVQMEGRAPLQQVVMVAQLLQASVSLKRTPGVQSAPYSASPAALGQRRVDP
jgi:hypothetical protein